MAKKFFILLVLALVIIATAAGAVLISSQKERQNKVCFGDNCFYVELATTSEERSQGLMFRESLDLNKGMLFVYSEEGMHIFWMKNTSIPLDIIWINANEEVVYISEDNEPYSENLIAPAANAKYVLEINAGLAREMGLNVGDKLDFNINIEE
ncbi:MAG TPA: DUF192 domain-containing protein [Candidatus Bathyarchaeia archaeon]